jgi:DNA-directed RNA polymerase subunit H (RpoH/RPB5)
MSLINNIKNSREVLKNILHERGYIANYEDYQIEQIEEIYDKGSISGDLSEVFTVSAEHKEIPKLKTHVIYYNLPKKGDSKTLRVTRSIINTIDSMYEDEDINYEDNIIILINGNLSDSIVDLMYKYNMLAQDKLKHGEIDDLNSTIQKYIEKKDSVYNIKSFHNVHIINIKKVSIDPLNHSLVPKHRIVKNEKEINEILINTNTEKNQLAIINSYTDTIAILLGATPGDVCEISRINKHSGVSVNYRLCC